MRTKAVVLSVLIAGLGQAYLGRFGRALIWFAGVIGVTVALNRDDTADNVRLLFGVVLGILSGIDAGVVAPGPPADGDGTGTR